MKIPGTTIINVSRECTHGKKCKHTKAYRTSFGQMYCPKCDRNIK